MAANIEKLVIEKLHGLPEDQQAEVRNFVERLARRTEPGTKTIFEEIREIMADVPDEVWERIPTSDTRA
jgi:uncharacterized protein (UPF0335 family)